MRERLARTDGRRLFGTAPEAYDRGRPGHAERVYEILCERCGLRPTTKTLEIGPGTGQATRRLLELGADPLVALEPDPGLASYLLEHLGARIQLRATTLEDAELEDDFDLAVAASAFHWVDEEVGLERIHGALRPGGGVALWWTVAGDPTRTDAFRTAIDPIMTALPRNLSDPDPGRPAYQSDGAARVAALESAGFEDVLPHRIEWEHTWDAQGIRDLFGSFSPFLAVEPGKRDELLDEIARIAEVDFGGRVTKPLVTALYTARKPF